MNKRSVLSFLSFETRFKSHCLVFENIFPDKTFFHLLRRYYTNMGKAIGSIITILLK